MNIIKWFRKLFRKKEEPIVTLPPEEPRIIEGSIPSREISDHTIHVERIRPKRRMFVRKPGHQAIHQDKGKFMKGSKHQLPSYRRSVKARISPEEDENV